MDSTDSEWLILQDYATTLGVTKTAIKKAIINGRIPASAVSKTNIGGRGGKNNRTLIHKPTADASWLATENPSSKRTKKSKERVEQLRSELSTTDTPIVEKEEDYKISFSEALRREKTAKAGLAHLSFLEKQGITITKDTAYKQLFDAGQILRDDIMSIPDRITAEIAAAGSNKNRIRKILTEALASSLGKLEDVYSKKLE